MNAQFFIAAGLRVCNQMVNSFFGQLLSLNSGVVFAVVMLASMVHTSPATAEDYDIIIEKNLFHNQRQKWEMEKSQAKGAASQAGPRDQSIDKINLFGTVIKDSQSYAVMRVNQPAGKRASSRRTSRRTERNKDRQQAGTQKQDSKRPYAVGDFISGYQIVEIRAESVLLQDPYDNKQYEIFMNDGQTERTAVRTEIADDKPVRPTQASGKERKPTRSPKAKPESSSKKAASTDAIRKRFERDLKILREEKNDAVERQAERNLKKLEPMMPSMDEKGQEELIRLKSEFEKLRQ